MNLLLPGSKFGEVIEALSKKKAAQFSLFLVAVTGVKEIKSLAKLYDGTVKKIELSLKEFYVNDRQIKQAMEKLGVEQPQDNKQRAMLSLIDPIPLKYV